MNAEINQSNWPNSYTEDQARESVLFVNELVKTSQTGPQSETIEEEYLLNALMDERTVCIETENKRLPILIPIDVMKDFKPDFIAHLAFDMDTTYFLPTYAGLIDRVPDIVEAIRQKIAEVGNHSDVHVFTYAHEDDKDELAYLNAVLQDSQEIPIIDNKNGTQACITHFDGLVIPKEGNAGAVSNYETLRAVFLDLVKKGELQEDVTDGVTILDPQKIANDVELGEQLWDLCESQFADLGEGLPFEQGFDKDEFINDVLSDPMTTTITNYKDGRPNSVAVFMHDIANAYWLNKDFYEQKYKDDFLSYYVLIATEKGASGRPAVDIIKMLVKLTQEAKRPMWVTFECTNVSSAYVPKIVDRVINSSESLKIEIDGTGHYPIRAFKLNLV
jgi:hypothetical protein